MKIHALIFDLEYPPPASKQLIAWIDQPGNGKHTQHAHPSKTLLDVEAVHTIIHRRQQYVVTGVRPYRTTQCKDETRYPTVKSGREWLVAESA
ncbi:MAG: hypothetical protein HON53_19260 [Planctomycetaceae bacterium]|nr:hypothetical protein [Planctomycetaceae bacterium]MBT6153722.1 hypothetical protein [Planctomycetaceae bacterium]MBT6485537.1 hypothetical protein [Planctomycetaceae bacterium]MBT6494403.1 hypothetical protein [Planctomycetaceae bacterium]